VNTQPSISVIIPAYNSAAWIGEAIQSALDQTLPPFEVLVVDDGSRDNTREVVSGFPSPVRIISQANGGPGKARNLGARSAQGDWLAFLDSDDFWHPAKLEKQACLASETGAGLVHTLLENGYQCTIPPVVTFDRLWEGNCIGTSSVMILKQVFFDVGGFAEDLPPAEDYHLWLRVAASGRKIVTCMETLAFYRKPPGCLSRDEERLNDRVLACIERIGDELHLPQEKIERRRLAVFDGCGKTLLYERKLAAARHWIGRALAIDPSINRTLMWLATFFPEPVLNARRKLF
jgi:glycosyltransferase involved in cell wall biosynthesis